jgi:hypothetical protein
MNGIEVDRMISDMTSGQPDRQIPALDQACHLVNHLVQIAVDALEAGPERFLVAERLHWLGPTAVGPLEVLLMRTDNSEVRILASLVLLQLGSRVGIHWLLQGVLEDHNYAGLVVGHLAKNGIYEAVDRIVARLRVSDAADLDLIVASLDALETLKADLPSDLLTKFTAPSMPWQVRTAAEHSKSIKSDI